MDADNEYRRAEDEKESEHYIDETDLGTPITKVKDKNGNERQLTVEEALEHEFGHVWEQQGFGKQRVGNKNEAIKWENKYRKSKGVNFIRHDPDHSSY